MKKKNSGKCLLAAAAMLLMVSPSAAQKYKVAKVERTRILIDQRWDAKPDAEAAQFIAPYKNKVDSIMGPVVGSIAHDMTRHRPESELSNLLCDILVWGGRQFNEQPVFSVYNWVASVVTSLRVRLLWVMSMIWLHLKTKSAF